MTTNCGSLTPAARATRVAAGMPTNVMNAAARIVAQVRALGGRSEAIPAQRKTVATDAHVPGPGFRRPAPKKVATRLAQTGANEFVATAGGPTLASVGPGFTLRPCWLDLAATRR